MKIRTPAAFLLLLCLVFTAGAQAPGVPPAPIPAPAPIPPNLRPAAVLAPDDPSPLLDLTLEETWSRFGPPRRILAVRGDEPWQDDVAFEYQGGLAIYWYRDRPWQVRLSAGYPGSCFGVFLGDTADKALSLLGTPDRRESEILEWRLPYRGYPVRLRFLARNGAVAEAYVYRTDF